MKESNYSPNLKPVQKIELDDSKLSKKLWILLVVFAVAIVALTVAINGFIKVETGLTAIQANPTVVGSDTDFSLQYVIGSSDELSPRIELKSVTTAYSAACDEAYKLFSADTAFDGVKNIHYLNTHPNEECVVSEELYSVFELIKKYDDRSIYLSPLSVDYMNLFISENDIAAYEFDPYENAELAESHAKIAEYAVNPDMVDVKLLGDNKLMLCVADDYLSFAENEGITQFIDLMWLKNAFSVDFIAKRLVDEGFKYGTLTSSDGFSCNLNTESSESFTLGVINRLNGSLNGVASAYYTGSANICYLRNFRLHSQDVFRCYERSDGESRTYYLDVHDGICRTACDVFIGASRDLSCAELALKMSPIYISETLDEGRLEELSKECGYIVVEDERLSFGDKIFSVASHEAE